jgi:hypothetical protein
LAEAVMLCINPRPEDRPETMEHWLRLVRRVLSEDDQTSG